MGLLCILLRTGFCYFQNLLKVHDQLTGDTQLSEDQETKDYSFKQYGEGAVRIIHLEKTSEPLVSPLTATRLVCFLLACPVRNAISEKPRFAVLHLCFQERSSCYRDIEEHRIRGDNSKSFLKHNN